MRQLAILFLIYFITACASIPDSLPEDEIADEAISSHQQSLSHIEAWEFQSRMAFVDVANNNRQAASLRWRNLVDARELRLSHPLRGTLARLNEDSSGAVLTDNQGQQFEANDIESLLLIHLNVFLPIELIHDALLGRFPDTEIINPTYYSDGTLAQYEVDLSVDNQQNWWLGDAGETWRISLARYQSAHNDAVLLPHQLEIHSETYQITLNISRWTLL